MKRESPPSSTSSGTSIVTRLIALATESRFPWVRGSRPGVLVRLLIGKETAMSSGRLCARCGGRLPAFLLLCVLRGFDLRYFLQPQCPGGLLAQHEFLHLAAGRQGIGLHKLEVARNLLVTDLPFAEVP